MSPANSCPDVSKTNSHNFKGSIWAYFHVTSKYAIIMQVAGFQTMRECTDCEPQSGVLGRS